MQISASVVLGVLFVLVDEKAFVSCQENVTFTNVTAVPIADEVSMMMTEGPMTDSPVEGDGLIPVEPEIEIETSAPTDATTIAVVETISPSLRGSEEASDIETMVPTAGETIAQTMAEVEVEFDEGGSNFTDFDEVEQEVAGNVTVETDATEMPMNTAAPIEDETVTDTIAPTGPPMTDATISPSTVAPETASPTEPADETAGLVGTETDETADSGEPATECAVQVFNTDPVCGQLLEFTNAECDCYNFCSGKLIACLKYGERNSFSCTGETVAGCTADQKIVSGAQQRLLAGSVTAVLAASAAALFV